MKVVAIFEKSSELHKVTHALETGAKTSKTKEDRNEHIMNICEK